MPVPVMGEWFRCTATTGSNWDGSSGTWPAPPASLRPKFLGWLGWTEPNSIDVYLLGSEVSLARKQNTQKFDVNRFFTLKPQDWSDSLETPAVQ